MRNLQLVDCSVVSDVQLSGCKLFTIDTDLKLVYCLSKTHIIAVEQFSKKVCVYLSYYYNN